MYCESKEVLVGASEWLFPDPLSLEMKLCESPRAEVLWPGSWHTPEQQAD